MLIISKDYFFGGGAGGGGGGAGGAEAKRYYIGLGANGLFWEAKLERPVEITVIKSDYYCFKYYVYIQSVWIGFSTSLFTNAKINLLLSRK